jgi:hypothetical protein
MEGISDFRGTGLITTIGGPAIICLCIANFLGRVKINWYLLAPFIQAYIVIGAYIALFGLHLSIPFYQTVLFIVFGSTLVSTVLCHIIRMNAAYNIIRRSSSMTFEGFLIGVAGAYILLQSLSTLLVNGFYMKSIDDCLSYIRCRVYANGMGFPGFSGSLIFPLLFSGVGATWAYFATFAVRPMEEKDE